MSSDDRQQRWASTLWRRCCAGRLPPALLLRRAAMTQFPPPPAASALEALRNTALHNSAAAQQRRSTNELQTPLPKSDDTKGALITSADLEYIHSRRFIRGRGWWRVDLQRGPREDLLQKVSIQVGCIRRRGRSPVRSSGRDKVALKPAHPDVRGQHTLSKAVCFYVGKCAFATAVTSRSPLECLGIVGIGIRNWNLFFCFS